MASRDTGPAVAVDRRAAAPHPGPIVRAEFLEPLGLSVDALSAHLGMERDRLAEMLAGRRSIDIDAAVRLARAFEVPADRIIEMQVRHDFAAARSAAAAAVTLVREPASTTFAELCMHGHLGVVRNDAGAATSIYFQETVAADAPGAHLGLHALYRGDRLRVFAPENGRVVFVGPVLRDFDDNLFLPFAPADEWRRWFAEGYAADMAPGPEHLAFFERMREV